MKGLVFLKLGGSLITDKDRPHTARKRTLRRIAREIAQALAETPPLRLLIGHGSGSFGHVPAARHGTRNGVEGVAGWAGFHEVWQEARALNQIVVEALLAEGVPVIAFPPSSWLQTQARQPLDDVLPPIADALAAGLVPLVNGDTVFDTQLGGTILSTEEIFSLLAPVLRPDRVLVSGSEAGIWADYPQRSAIISDYHVSLNGTLPPNLGGSASTDVTGGMLRKAEILAAVAGALPECEIRIFGGKPRGNILRALRGKALGTRILMN